jgi:hypothetical protein
MELCLLLLPLGVLLAIGWTGFPIMTTLFVGLMVAYTVRFLRQASEERARSSR